MIMKKSMMMLLAVASMSLSAMAQDDDTMSIDPAEKHRVATNGFWSNWFFQTNATWSAFYRQERVLVAPFRKFPGGSSHTNMGLSVALGKWFTPGLGLRTKLGLWQWGKQEQGVGGNKFWSLNEQVLFNFSNLFAGYNEHRFYSLIPYVGAGLNRDMSCNHYSTQLSAGLLNTFRISRHLSANLDLGWNSFEAGNQGIGLKQRAHQFTLEVGLTFNIGSSRWQHATDNDAKNALTEGELDALNAQLADAMAENERLQQLLDEQSKPAVAKTVTPPVRTVEQVVSAPVSIFFERGKSAVIASRDMLSVKALAELAIEKNASVLVTGYADTKTGTAEVNKRLSERRAQAVADELKRLGVNPQRIEVVAAGGVDTLTPAEYNRRVTVELR